MAEQEVNQRDWENRKTFAEKHVYNLVLLRSDDKNVHVYGQVNKQNVRCWLETDPQLHERPLHRDNVLQCVIGPRLFVEHGPTVKVNSDRYVFMLRNY